MIEQLSRETRHALRGLAATPGFTAVAVAAIALGIAALTPTFSLINAYLLRPLPFAEPDRLVHVWESSRTHDFDRMRVAWPNLRDWRTRSEAFEDLAAFNYTSETLTGGDTPERIASGRVSANAFDVLGVEPLLGRGFRTGEDHPGEHRVVVLSHASWQERFGGRRDVLGETLELNGEDHTIIGVMAPEFVFPLPSTRLWIPWPLDEATSPRDRHYLQVVGRLAPGATLERAEAELTAIAARLAAAYPESNEGWGVSFEPLRDALNFADEIIRVAAVVTLVAGAFVLAIACANVSSLLLARGLRRGREVAIRRALGAGRAQLARQLLVESLVLAGAGAAAGVLLAFWLVRVLAGAMPDDLYRVGEIDVDGTVLSLTLGVALLTSLVAGLLPALRITGTSLDAPLRAGRSATESHRRMRLQQGLVAGQISLALMLLVGTALIARSLAAMRSVDPGFDAERVLTGHLTLPADPYATAERRRQFHRAVVEEVRAVAGVEAAATVTYLPLNHEFSRASFTLSDAATGRVAEPPTVIDLAISPAYFEVMGIPLVTGRPFDDRDSVAAPNVAIVNEAFVDRWLGASGSDPSTDPLGRRLSLEEVEAPLEIVGVVANTRHVDLTPTAVPILYRPAAQAPSSYFRVLARTAADPLDSSGAVRRAVSSLDPDLPLTEVRSMAQVVGEFLLPQRIVSAALAGLSGGAILLAAVGIYGLLAFFVAQRRREMSIRMALGVRAADVMRHVLGNGVRLAAFGVGFGLLGALALGQVMSGLLFGVAAYDPPTLLGVPAALLLLTLIACGGPAWRATRADPIAAMRGD